MTLLTFGRWRTRPDSSRASRLGRFRQPPRNGSAPAVSASRRVTPPPPPPPRRGDGCGVPRTVIIVPLHPERRPAGGRRARRDEVTSCLVLLREPSSGIREGGA